jgi:hypothetical protein
MSETQVATSIPVSRRTPSMLVVARQQMRLIDATKRFPLMLAVFAGVAAIALGPGPVGIPESVFPFVSILLATIAWPVLVWSGESPARRGYHRILPVNHVTHDLLKVFAGACWLMLACAIILSTLIIVTVATGFGSVIQGLSPTVFASYFSAPLIVYLFVSMIPILTNRPIEWMLGIAIGLVGFNAVADSYPLTDPPSRIDVIVETIKELIAVPFESLWSAMFVGYIDQPWYFLFGLGARAAPSIVDLGAWLTATVLWTTIGIVAVTGASFIANRRAERGRDI